jgi:hypothetical protein
MDLLRPILVEVASLRPQQRTTAAQGEELERILEQRFAWAGERIQAVGAAIERGIAQGWLCNRGDAHARFSRLAKPSADTADLSIDVVSMIGDAIDHTHPNGEVTIGFPAAGEPAQAVRFEGRGPGWVFCRPGSRHVPHVDGGRMNLIYFLPDGAVQWHGA